ncbi:MAG: Asp-tRNA(Asn)/Glu-tRNA(Gln) amidotransferase subunit GatB, partial [Candidatus Riflebacteria bacterium]|nr:Asp-tRNA(Asn)/Glu-tRNA(Gln) amidotransferase subunit GatB [Candidatus Riflebacteria bacterium]
MESRTGREADPAVRRISESEYEPVIGLEVHVQLSTRSKLFCGCSTAYERQPPNTFVCPVCSGLPGVLPVLNQEALRLAVKTVLAIGGTVSAFSRFDRKNYFYPDLPKAYQISQYDRPIGRGGTVQAGSTRIGVHRVHLEEDAGKLIHEEGGSRSLVDYNRASVPLLEIVSEPQIGSPEEAKAYLEELKAILQYIEVSDCNMEEGSLRCDANVSIRPRGDPKLGTKTEIKNLNSFKGVARALEYEIARQVQGVRSGDRLVQETRLYDPDRGVTVAMRSKEEAHDYRYFPEPDLPPVVLDDEYVEAVRATLPELPAAKRQRFCTQYGLAARDAGVLTCEAALARYFEEACATSSNHEAVKNWIAVELLGRLRDAGLPIQRCPIAAGHVGRLVGLIDDRTVSGKMAKQIFDEMFSTGAAPASIVNARGLSMIGDRGAVEAIV